MVAEGSDWFWWFGEHHHTELDHVWDLEFSSTSRRSTGSWGSRSPSGSTCPCFAAARGDPPGCRPATIEPVDRRQTHRRGRLGRRRASLPPDHPSTMQRAEGARIVEARFGWGAEHLYLLLIPRDRTDLEGLEIDLTVTPAGGEDESVVPHGARGRRADGRKLQPDADTWPEPRPGRWRDVVEIALPARRPGARRRRRLALVLRVGRGGMTDHVFRSAGLAPLWRGGVNR